METRWWSKVPKTSDDAGEGEVEWNKGGASVHQMPKAGLDQLERNVRQAEGSVISAAAAVDRAIIGYNESLQVLQEARTRFAERLKESGARIEFTQHYQPIPLDEKKS